MTYVERELLPLGFRLVESTENKVVLSLGPLKFQFDCCCPTYPEIKALGCPLHHSGPGSSWPVNEAKKIVAKNDKKYIRSQSDSDKISLIVKELVSTIRTFSKEQKEIWQKVPFLALRADGRTGYSGQYSRAYETGYWAVESIVSNGSYSVYVDLETGELVSAFDPRNRARDEYVLLIASNPAMIDATRIIEMINRDADKSTFSGYDVAKQEAWRLATVSAYGLKPGEYKRKISPEQVYKNNLASYLMD